MTNEGGNEWFCFLFFFHSEGFFRVTADTEMVRFTLSYLSIYIVLKLPFTMMDMKTFRYKFKPKCIDTYT